MRHWQKLAALLLATACSGDATAPDPATVEPQPQPLAANRAPVATADSIPAVRLPGPGEAVGVAVGAYFNDPDGDALTFATASTDTAVVAATVAGDTLRLVGGGTGGAGTVTVTATDPAGLAARVAVAVAVNRAPVVAGEIPALINGSPYGGTKGVDVSSTFVDPDGDSLAFAAYSSDPSVVVAGLWGRCVGHAESSHRCRLLLRPGGVGEATVTVTASDPDSLEAQAVFAVAVTPRPWERAALVALYEATDGPNWTNNENWLTDAPLGEWHGVDLHFDTSVDALNLSDNNLTGPIPPELGSLFRLRTLNLSGNNLSGPIPPELGGPVSQSSGQLWIHRLDLSGNNLSGLIPPELSNLRHLQRLDLRRNDLSGPIPVELGNLAGLDVRLSGNPGLCAPEHPDLRAWLVERDHQFLKECQPVDRRLLPLALMRADGNGLALELPDSLRDPSAVNVSDPGVVAATVADGWLSLVPRSIGRADVELVPNGDGLPAVAGVAVREGVGTFGIDILMTRPAPFLYEEGMVEAADWWSYLLDGTEWPDSEQCIGGPIASDELLIGVYSDETRSLGRPAGIAFPCLERSNRDPLTFRSRGGRVWVAPYYTNDQGVIRHEIGHILGLVLLDGLKTEDGEYFTGPRAVEAYRAGGGDPNLPGVPLYEGTGPFACWCHWNADELMGPYGGASDALSLAALADGGYTVDMTKATPWRAYGAAAAAAPFRDVVEVRIVPRPVPE